MPLRSEPSSHVSRELEATVEEVLEAQESARNLDLENVKQVSQIAHPCHMCFKYAR